MTAQPINTGTGRYIRSSLNPRMVIDVWVINQWNEANRLSREHYYHLMRNPRWSGVHMRLCTICRRTNTSHKSRECWGCRYDAYLRDQTSLIECTACGVRRTKNPLRLCEDCRRYQELAARAGEWHECVITRCQAMTRLAGTMCYSCRMGRPPQLVGHHWSRRFKGSS